MVGESVSPISACGSVTVEMANRCPVSTMVELKISAGRFNERASAPHAERVASASFAFGLNLLSKTFAPLSLQDASAIVANISN